MCANNSNCRIRFPLSNLGCGHTDDDFARGHTLALIAQAYDIINTIGARGFESTQHSFTVSAFHPSRDLRHKLEGWARGVMEETSDVMLFRDKLLGCPVMERWIEAFHLRLKRLGAFKHVKGGFLSFAHRQHVFRMLLEDPELLKLLYSNFHGAAVIGLIKRLGLVDNPLVQQLLNDGSIRPAESTQWMAKIKQLSTITTTHELLHLIFASTGGERVPSPLS